jgi:outer membrane protein TolC
MKKWDSIRRLDLLCSNVKLSLLCAFSLLFSAHLFAQTNAASESIIIDLPTVLRLANAQNLDVQIARQKVKEAKAVRDSATLQFFPWLSPGFTFRGHDNLIQAVDGQIIQAHKQSYAPGVTLGGQWEIGDAIYKSLAAKQQVKAAEQGAEAERQAMAFNAVQNYFELSFAQAAVRVAEQAIGISTNYEAQLHEAVGAGLAYKGDELRARVQAEKNQLTLAQAIEHQKLLSAQLAQTLHLDPATELVAKDEDFAPLLVVDTNSTLHFCIAQALANRPEMKQSGALIKSAKETKRGATQGPWIPSANAQVFVGGLGGSSDAGPSRFGDQEDYFLGLSWKIGQGGLFDSTRVHSAEARLKIAEFSREKLEDEISRQVVDAFIRMQSIERQLESARRALAAAEESLKLTQLRKEFAVGIVLENIQSEQDLTRARFEYLKLVAEFNKAQYAMRRVLGAF